MFSEFGHEKYGNFRCQILVVRLCGNLWIFNDEFSGEFYVKVILVLKPEINCNLFVNKTSMDRKFFYSVELCGNL